MLACECCASDVQCGHADCYALRLAELLITSPAQYLCPSCLQAHGEAMGLEPLVEVTDELLADVELLVGSPSLCAQLRSAADAEGIGRVEARVAIISKHVTALRTVGGEAGLLHTTGFVNALGALVGLQAAECLRVVPINTRQAAAIVASFRREDGLHQSTQRQHVASMERLLLGATGSRGAFSAELGRFDVLTAERLVLRFVRDEACNEMQLQLDELVGEVAEAEHGEEIIQPDGGFGVAPRVGTASDDWQSR